jgi:hypothetical protein
MLFIVGLLALAALVFVTYPLINPKKHVYYLDDLLGTKEEKKLTYLKSKKNLVYSNIKDLDMEYQMGKLADVDYHRLRNELLGEAEGVVKEIDDARVKRDIEDLIEDEVRSRRKIK